MTATPPPPRRRTSRAFPALGISLLLTALAVPVVRHASEAWDFDLAMTSHHSWSEGAARSLDFWHRGDLELADDDRSITGLSPDGVVKVRERRGLSRRTVKITPGGGGELAYHYQVSGRERPFDDDGRRWLAAVLQEVVARAAIGAEERVARLFAEGGLDAVLERIETLPTDYARAAYYDVVLEGEKLATGERPRVLAHLTRRLEGDFYLHRALAGELERDRSSAAAVMAAARGLDADYYRSELLRSIARRLTPELVGEYLSLADRSSSEYYRQQALDGLVERPRLARPNLAALLGVTSRFGSDYHRAQVLRAVAPWIGDEPTARPAFFTALDGLGSEYHRREVLGALLEAGLDDADLRRRYLTAVEDLDSSYERSQLLSKAADALRDDQAAMLMLVDALAGLDDYYAVTAFDRLLDERRLDRTLLERLRLRVDEKTDRSHERRRLLDEIDARLSAAPSSAPASSPSPAPGDDR